MTTTFTITHVWHKTEALLGTNMEDAWERFPVIKRTAQFTFVQRVPECEETVLPDYRQSDPVRLKTADLVSKGSAWIARTRDFYRLQPQLDETIVWRKTAMGYTADTEATQERDRQRQAERERDPKYLTDRMADLDREGKDLWDGMSTNRDLSWWSDQQFKEWCRLRAKLIEAEALK